MFSGFNSFLFGKKHKHKQEESVDDNSQVSTDGDFVILERRHSDEYDRISGLYPNLDPSNPSSSNLPYGISPSLPNLKDATSKSPTEETKIDILQGVPFVLSSQLLLLEEKANESLSKIINCFKQLKDAGGENFLDDYNYDFELEHTVSSEFTSYDD